MEYGLYSIQDTMIGFGSPLIFVNEEAAKREYTNWLKSSKNPTDMRFYKVGKFDDQTGVVESMSPIMILGGGNNEGEVQNTVG